MVKCQHCQHVNREGVLVCDECGAGLWSGQARVSTRTLDDDSGDLSVKSGWGTATFQERGQIIIHIRNAGEAITVNPGEEFILGRQDTGSGVVPDLDLTPYGALDQGVSRTHAAIRRGDKVLSIVDLGSSNGTYLNGQRLIVDKPRLLRDGDELWLGRLTLHVYFR